jgi:hypothetical protein
LSHESKLRAEPKPSFETEQFDLQTPEKKPFWVAVGLRGLQK